MKILHIINNLGSGGAEKLLEEMIPLMNQTDNIEVDILLLTDKNNVFSDSLTNKGVRIDVIKYRSIYDPRNILEIKRHVSKKKYDVVHSHLFPTQYWVALSRIFLKNNTVKFITTEHSTHNRRREKFLFRLLDRFIYSKYDVIISITEKTRDNLIKWVDPKRKNIDKHIVIENGVNLETIKRAVPYKKTDLVDGIDENTKLVCMVGRFHEAKDQPTLIKAIGKLSEDIHLLLVGEGPLIDKNKNLVKELGIFNRVHFLGFRHDVPRILKTVDIVVLSSHWEGLSLASIEGLASGKPFIASRVNGLEEIVGEDELLFEEENVDELVSIMNRLLTVKQFHDRAIYKCLERSGNYELKNSIKKITKLYFL